MEQKRTGYENSKQGKRVLKEKFFNKKVTTRNWEIQFRGDENDKNLKDHLFGNKNFSEFIPEKTVREYYDKFKNTDSVYYSHPVSMLLTLSVFCRKFKDKAN